MRDPNKCPVEIQLSSKGSNLYIFFGGIAAGISMPPFEFYQSSKIIDENKIFIRDHSQCWYQCGLPGIGNDINSTANYILQKIREIKPKKIFFVGNSMGGYAAILFAYLIGKGEAIAFATQTFIAPLLRLKYGDFRWTRQIFGTYMKGFFKTRIWDLKPLISSSDKELKVSIYVSLEDRLDHMHALHLREIKDIKIFEFDSGGHSVVKWLRDEGKLPAIMSGTYI